jgi:hypothetical protein
MLYFFMRCVRKWHCIVVLHYNTYSLVRYIYHMHRLNQKTN